MRVSVIVPVYNDTRLGACLDSLVPQTVAFPGEAEIVVVDNGSRIDIRRICRRFANNVTYIREPKVGSYAARNTGLATARADIYAFTDADCEPHPDWLHTGFRAFQDGDAQVLTGPIRLVAVHQSRLNLSETHQMATGFPVEHYVTERNFAPAANLWIRASVLEKVGTFNERLLSGGDLDWGRRAHRCGYRIRYCDKLVVCHPVRDNLRSLADKSRRTTGGHYTLSRYERRLLALLWAKLWPRRAVRLILSNGRISRAQKGRALLIELFWLYWVRLAELGRLLAGGKALR